MTKLDAMLEKMPTAQRRQVEEFAAQLLGSGATSPLSGVERPTPNRIRFDELERLIPHDLGGDDDQDEKRRALGAWADSAED